MANTTPRRALIVIDVQNEYVTGNFLIEYPPVRVSLANIGKAIDAAIAHHVPVVVVQHVLPKDAPIFAEGSEGAALHPSVARRHWDHLIVKTLPSVFAQTDFDQWLQHHSIDTLTVIGYMTHNCDDSTVREAMHAGYSVEFLPDAAGSLSYCNRAGSASAEDIHRVVSVVMQSAYAAVMSTDEWTTLLDGTGSAERDNIYDSNQRAIAAHSSLWARDDQLTAR